MIEVKNLVKRYGDNPAVDHLSFTLEPGRIYGFLGPNGAGKSTTMNIMTGYLGATEGEVIINGHNIVDEPELAKKCIGYLPEIPPLYPDMTVNEYLSFAAELKKIPKTDRFDQVEAAKELARVQGVEDKLIRNLSKGYKQRVGLAGAVLGLPEIIILDEPTVGLDPKQIIEIRDVIKSLSKDHTVILSSHILSEVSEVCDYVLIISHGRLVASDTIENLYRYQGDTSELHLQVKGDAVRVQEVLTQVDGVNEVEVTQQGELVDVTVRYDDSDTTVEAVFYALADAKLPIFGMNKITKSLEQMFIELTDSKQSEDEDEDAEESCQESEDEV